MTMWQKQAVRFSVGGIGYGVLECLWRGHTHWSMVAAGGVCFTAFSVIAKRFVDRCLWYKALLCAVCVTTVELLFGVVFNLILKKRVWDYSNHRFHLFGQICPLYSALWYLLSCGCLPLVSYVNRKLNL